jgi:hypothetical protein
LQADFNQYRLRTEDNRPKGMDVKDVIKESTCYMLRQTWQKEENKTMKVKEIEKEGIQERKVQPRCLDKERTETMVIN